MLSKINEKLEEAYPYFSLKKNQEKEVTSYYDMGNDFYKLWLGEKLQRVPRAGEENV